MKIQWNASHPDQALLTMSMAEFEQKYKEIWKKAILLQEEKKPRFCQAGSYQGVLSGTFVVPERKHPIQTRFSFGFAMTNDQLFFVGDEKALKKVMDDFCQQYDFVYNSPLEFLLGFMNYMIRRDVYFLEDYNLKLEDIEVDLFEGKQVDMSRFIMDTRKDMNILDNYYMQLNAMGQTLQEIEMENKTDEMESFLSIYLSRVSMLGSMVQTIKNYTSQIWNLRQTQEADHQNKISTILTIVTALFLPLTLVTGWFGMNFNHMPLIDSPWGYYATVGFCLLVIAAELFYIWKKHWWRSDKD